MTLQELQIQLKNGSFCSDRLIIFESPENNFVAQQYVKQISEIKGMEICYVEEISTQGIEDEDLFGVQKVFDPVLSVYVTSEFSTEDPLIMSLTNTVIVATKIDKKTKEQLKAFIIEIPKLLDWQVKDYMYSKAQGVDTKKLDWLQSACKNDIYKIDNEMNKFSIFQPEERNFLFDKMLDEEMYSDLSNLTIFNLINALNRKDIEAIRDIYVQKNSIDISDMALLSLVCQNLRNLILVHLNPNPTPDNTGLSDKQIYAIKKTPLKWNKEHMFLIFEKINSIDCKIKSGEFPIEILFDYIILTMIGMSEK